MLSKTLTGALPTSVIFDEINRLGLERKLMPAPPSKHRYARFERAKAKKRNKRK